MAPSIFSNYHTMKVRSNIPYLVDGFNPSEKKKTWVSVWILKLLTGKITCSKPPPTLEHLKIMAYFSHNMNLTAIINHRPKNSLDHKEQQIIILNYFTSRDPHHDMSRRIRP